MTLHVFHKVSLFLFAFLFIYFTIFLGEWQNKKVMWQQKGAITHIVWTKTTYSLEDTEMTTTQQRFLHTENRMICRGVMSKWIFK